MMAREVWSCAGADAAGADAAAAKLLAPLILAAAGAVGVAVRARFSDRDDEALVDGVDVLATRLLPPGIPQTLVRCLHACAATIFMRRSRHRLAWKIDVRVRSVCCRNRHRAMTSWFVLVGLLAAIGWTPVDAAL